MRLVRRLAGVLVLLAFGLWASPASAVIIYGNPEDKSETGRNLASVEAIPSNLGQYVAPFFGGLGTPISSTHFVTAQHITGGATTASFEFGAKTYAVEYVSRQNDLAVWKISAADQTFPSWAPLYTDSVSSTVGQTMVIIGRGTARGGAVSKGGTQRGWDSGAGDGQISWGTNKVSEVFHLTSTEYPTLAEYAGDLLRFTFDAPGHVYGDNKGPTQSFDEGFLTGGDSGGVVFVIDAADGNYKLAGVNSLTDVVSDEPNGARPYRALYDVAGFYSGATLIPDTVANIPLGSYATSIPSRLDFLGQFVPVPEPSSIVLIGAVALGGAACGWRRRRKATPPAS